MKEKDAHKIAEIVSEDYKKFTNLKLK